MAKPTTALTKTPPTNPRCIEPAARAGQHELRGPRALDDARDVARDAERDASVDAERDAAPQLTPAEIAAREAEKAALVAAVRARRRQAASPAPAEPPAELPLAAETDTSADANAAAAAPWSDLAAVQAKLAETTAALAVVEAEAASAEREYADAQRARQEAYEATLAELRARRRELQAEAEQHTRQAEAAALVERVRALQAERERADALARADLAEKTCALNERIEPALQAVQRRLTKFREFEVKYLRVLDSLAGAAPATWPAVLQIEYTQTVALKAAELRTLLLTAVKGHQRLVEAAAKLLRFGWRPEQAFEGEVRQFLWEAGLSEGLPESVLAELALLQQRVGGLEDDARNLAVSGLPVPEVVELIPAGERLEGARRLGMGVSEIEAAALARARDARAEGVDF